jgi:hypothetical protein
VRDVAWAIIDPPELRSSQGVTLKSGENGRAEQIAIIGSRSSPPPSVRGAAQDPEQSGVGPHGQGTQNRNEFVPGQFVNPHGACFDANGDIFVAEWVEIGRVSKLRRV